MNEKVKKYSNSVSKRYWWSIIFLNRTHFKLMVLPAIKVNSVEIWNFSFFIAIFSHINQPCSKWANFLRKSGT